MPEVVAQKIIAVYCGISPLSTTFFFSSVAALVAGVATGLVAASAVYALVPINMAKSIRKSVTLLSIFDLN